MADRYSAEELDSPSMVDGDVGFVALNSRMQPENLPPGVVQASENMRMEQGIAVTRQGMEKMTNSIDPGGTVPLLVPFTVGSSALVRDTWADGIFGSCVFSDPENANKNWLILATGSSAFAFSPGETVREMAYPSGQTIVESDKVDLFQADGSVYILRGESAAPQGAIRISRSGTTATLVSPSTGHGLSTGDRLNITGAYPDWYNVTFAPVTVSNGTTLTYTTGAVTDLADSLLEAATTNPHYTEQAFTFSAVSYTVSVYVKANARDWIFITNAAGGASERSCYFNVSTGVVGTASGTTGTIIDAGGGWYRCAMAFTAPAGAAVVRFNVNTDGTGAGNSYAGDVTKGLFLFGAQLELGLVATDYDTATAAASGVNHLTYSEDFTNAAWTKSQATVGGNATAEPAARVAIADADRILEVANTGLHYTIQSFTYEAAEYTASVYAKPNGRSWLQITDGNAGHSCFFDITNGLIGTAQNGASAVIEAAGGGWYRCSATFTPSAGAAEIRFAVCLSDNSASTPYLGDVTKGVDLYGAQLEIGAEATEYQETAASAGVRNLLTHSGEFANAAWPRNELTATGNQLIGPPPGSVVLNQRKAPLRWDGEFDEDFVAVSQGTISAPYIYMPPSDYGILQQNRAIIQYARNQCIVSDVLDVESYDSIFGVFTFASGQADYLMAFHPYQDNKTLIFNRRSIYLINEIDVDPNAMTTQEITRQVGCVSRLSLATCGSDVLFLSDLGVFRLQPGLELQLRGNSEPLSAPIDDVIRTINFDAIQRANAVYVNNRYYLAIPVNGSTRNNRILVYSFLLNAWESVDTLPTGFYPDFLEVMPYNNVDTLFMASAEGGVYAYEQLEVDEFGAAPSEPSDFVIAGRLRTRRFTFGTYNVKRFNRLSANLSLNANSGVTVSVNTVNPDATKTLQNYSVTDAEDITYPLIIGKRGYGCDVEFTNTAGRTTIVNNSVGATIMGRKNIKLT